MLDETDIFAPQTSEQPTGQIYSNDPDRFLRIFEETKEPAYDVETNGLDWKRCFVCGYSVSDGKEAVYVSVRHGGGGNIEQVAAFEAEIARIAKKHQGKIVGHNIKFDMHFSQNHGVQLGNKVGDTMTTACILNENRRGFSLGAVARGYKIAQKKEGILYEHIGRLFNVKPDRSAMGHYWRLSGIDPIAVEYAGYDTLVTKQLWECQKKEIYEQNLDTVLGLEDNLAYVLQKMERRGIGVDPEERQRVVDKIQDMYLKAYSKLPVDENYVAINVNSKKDLIQYFEMCDNTDWPMTAPTQRFPDGQPSFNKGWLLSSQEGLDILNVRKLEHLKSSFLDTLEEHVFNDRIHTTFNQARGETHGTRGGRLSSSNPNKQQVPKRDRELGRIYRRMFAAGPNYTLVEFDYSQAEPRLYTHYSAEPILLKGYTSTPVIDMHGVAAEYMGLNTKYGPTKEGLKQARDIAKNLNLGIMYTMGSKKLALQLGIPLQQAKEILRTWHNTFPQVSEFTKLAEQVAATRGYVKTILGRRRRFPDIDLTYRAANAIVQGGSADIMKWKLCEIDRYLETNNLEEVCLMLLTIHDSVVFEIHKDHLYILDKIREILEAVQVAPFYLKLPFKVDMGMGDNWSTATYGEEKLAA